MEDLNQEETTILTACRSCGAATHGCARFCRFCGAPMVEANVAALKANSHQLQTRPLQVADSYRPVSGPLIDAVGAGFGASRALQLRGGVARTLLFALISIPVWLLIVLLSPVDAYLAARAIASNQ